MPATPDYTDTGDGEPLEWWQYCAIACTLPHFPKGPDEVVERAARFHGVTLDPARVAIAWERHLAAEAASVPAAVYTLDFKTGTFRRKR